jgi:hypothetical protein
MALSSSNSALVKLAIDRTLRDEANADECAGCRRRRDVCTHVKLAASTVVYGGETSTVVRPGETSTVIHPASGEK